MSYKNNIQAKINNLIANQIKTIKELPEFSLQASQFKIFIINLLEETKKDINKLYESK
jgi:hypothetical protein